jgi:hypothetical protein
MRKIILTEKQEYNIAKMLFLEYIENLMGKTIISVDIQPEYEDNISFDLYEWGEYINMLGKNNRIVFLYNGQDTLGMVSEDEYKMWLYEFCGIDEEILYNSIFYDKGYAFFRYCIDEGIDDENIVKLVQFMMKHNINDSRDLTNNELWDMFIEEYDMYVEDVRELLEFADDMIYIPDLMDALKPLNNITIMGGGINECLKEVIIALDALNKPYNIIDEFCY